MKSIDLTYFENMLGSNLKKLKLVVSLYQTLGHIRTNGQQLDSLIYWPFQKALELCM